MVSAGGDDRLYTRVNTGGGGGGGQPAGQSIQALVSRGHSAAGSIYSP